MLRQFNSFNFISKNSSRNKVLNQNLRQLNILLILSSINPLPQIRRELSTKYIQSLNQQLKQTLLTQKIRPKKKN